MLKYYCRKCKRYHYRGKIYREHLKFKEIEENTNNSESKSFKVEFESLRPIAKRQLNRLLKKIDKTGRNEIYEKEIIKLIKNENRR
ncbi:MAG: hypothetical protein ACFE8B_13125 [Candidatus Hermodarchaeota archaeon]